MTLIDIPPPVPIVVVPIIRCNVPVTPFRPLTIPFTLLGVIRSRQILRFPPRTPAIAIVLGPPMRDWVTYVTNLLTALSSIHPPDVLNRVTTLVPPKTEWTALAGRVFPLSYVIVVLVLIAR